VTFRQEKFMKTATLISIGAAALAIAAGSVTAGPIADAATGRMEMMDDSPALASSMYEVDENRDGRVDRTLMLEQSDSLA
jgi:hypothetical protein